MDRTFELAHQIHDRLILKPGITISAAESCSGGGIASAITSVSGSSAYFLGSIVAYVNDAKHQLLGVSEEILESKGAVSSESAVAMAEGSRAVFGASIAVSTTGIAGPTGATSRKPVGLVYIACAHDGTTIVEEHFFSGDRGEVTHAAIVRGLEMVLDAIAR